MACISPYYANVNGRWIPTPCGRCPPCKKRRVDGWVFRLLQEDRRQTTAHFVTLTYASHSVPFSPNGFMTLDKTEFPRFMKRLRKLVSGTSSKYGPSLDKEVPKIKYYACGEYGSKNLRPHYHAIIFGVPDDAMYFDAWSLDGVSIGDIHVGNVSGNSVAYCMKYLDKRSNVGLHDRDDRVKEFALMSKGLGSNYVTPATTEYHKADLSRNYLTVDGGARIALPRYYRERLFDDDDKAQFGSIIELAMGKAESDNYAEFLKVYGDNPKYTYDKFVQSQREAIVNHFYSQQQIRD